jgi:hypothetical protein
VKPSGITTRTVFAVAGCDEGEVLCVLPEVVLCAGALLTGWEEEKPVLLTVLFCPPEVSELASLCGKLPASLLNTFPVSLDAVIVLLSFFAHAENERQIANIIKIETYFLIVTLTLFHCYISFYTYFRYNSIEFDLSQ